MNTGRPNSAVGGTRPPRPASAGGATSGAKVTHAGTKQDKTKRIWDRLRRENDQHRRPTYAPAVFSPQFGAFTTAMEGNTAYYVSRPLCMHVFPTTDYAKGTFRRQTSNLTGIVFGHIKEFHKNDLLAAFFSRQFAPNNQTTLTKPIVGVLAISDWMENNISDLLSTYADIFASNASKVRMGIAIELRRKYVTEKHAAAVAASKLKSGATPVEVTQGIDSVISDTYRESCTGHFENLMDSSIQHRPLYGVPNNQALIDLYIDKVIKEDDDATRAVNLALFETSCTTQEKHAVIVSTLCMTQMRHVYDELYKHFNKKNLVEECKTQVKMRYNTKPAGVVKTTVAPNVDIGAGGAPPAEQPPAGVDVASGSLFDKHTGRAINMLPAVYNSSTSIVAETDDFDVNVMDDLQVARTHLAYFLWDVVVERMEVLWSNVFSFFLISVAGDRTEAMKLTKIFMRMAVPVCLSPLFVAGNAPDVKTFRQESDVTEDAQAVRERDIGTYYANISVTGTRSLNMFFNGYVPVKLPDLLSSDKESVSLRASILLFVRSVVPHSNQFVCFQDGGLFSVTKALGSVDNDYSSIKELHSFQAKDPSLMGSPSFETRSVLRTLLQTHVVNVAISEEDRYNVIRKLMTAVFESDLTFYYMFILGDATRVDIKGKADSFALAFAQARFDPLSAFFSTEQKAEATLSATTMNLKYKTYVDTFKLDMAKPAKSKEFSVATFRKPTDSTKSQIFQLKNNAPLKSTSRASAEMGSARGTKADTKPAARPASTQPANNHKGGGGVPMPRKKKSALRNMKPSRPS